MSRVLASLCCLIVVATASSASAQMVNVAVPFQRLNNSFFENYDIGFGYDGRNADGSGFFFNGPGPALPPFGGFDPNGQAGFGIGNGRGFFNFAASQGSSSTLSTEIPSVTSMNGYPGSISNTSLRPFVTGFTPVVGADGRVTAGPFPIFVAPKYPTMADWAPQGASPLGLTREQIFQNVNRAKEEVAQQRLVTSKKQRLEDAKALADERARLRARASSKASTDDPPLKLSDQ